MNALHETSWQYIAPVYWGGDELDAHSVVNNGTCFFLRIGQKLFGVTAHHVIAQYLRDREINPALYLRIKNCRIEWEGREIGSDKGLDLSTFQMTEAEFREIKTLALTYTEKEWPIRTPEPGNGAFLSGFANKDRKIINRKSIEFVGHSNGLVVTAIGKQELEIVLDPTHLTSGGPLSTVPAEDHFGGFSGGPILAVSMRLDRVFFIAGVLIQSVHYTDDNKPLVSYIARRIDCINTDGTLWRPNYAKGGE